MIQPGTVVSYEQDRVVIQLLSGDTLPSLGPAYFHSGRPVRAPKVGDDVEVVTDSGKVLYVRPRRASRI